MYKIIIEREGTFRKARLYKYILLGVWLCIGSTKSDTYNYELPLAVNKWIVKHKIYGENVVDKSA